jgi:hypothetical protein
MWGADSGFAVGVCKTQVGTALYARNFNSRISIFCMGCVGVGVCNREILSAHLAFQKRAIFYAI